MIADTGYYIGDKYENSRKNIEKLKNLNDPRIWIIGTDTEFDNKTNWKKISSESEKELHFFDTIANDLFPDYTQDKIEEANKNLIELFRVTKEEGND